MSTPFFTRSPFTSVLLLAASSAGATACLSAGDDDAARIDGADSHIQGITLVPTNPPPPPPPSCVETVNANPAFGCIASAWIYGGSVGLESMLSAALGCGCEAEIVTTGVVPVACNVQRVAVSCGGTPRFNAVSPIPPGEYPCEGLTDEDGNPKVVIVDGLQELPFVGIHLDPSNNGRLCDVTLDPQAGPVDRVKIEKCSTCHTDNEPQWWPTETAPDIEVIETID